MPSDSREASSAADYDTDSLSEATTESPENSFVESDSSNSSGGAAHASSTSIKTIPLAASSVDLGESCTLAAGVLQPRRSHLSVRDSQAQHELLPEHDEIEANPDLVREIPFLTVMGSVVAVLSGLPRLREPSTRQNWADFGVPTRLSDKQMEAFPDMLDAVASLCVRENGEVHAIALVEAPKRLTILHAADLLPARGIDLSTDAPDTVSVGPHLQIVWEHLRRQSASNLATATSDFIVCAYQWCWDALYARFHPHARGVADGLWKISNRAYTVADIAGHPESWRFYNSFTDSELVLLADTHRYLDELLVLITPHAPDRKSVLTICNRLDIILQRWVDPFHDKSDNLLGHLVDHILCLETTSFFDQITWLSRACRQLAASALSFRAHFDRDLVVFDVDNPVSLFSGNLEHSDLLRIMRDIHDGDPRTFDADWHAHVTLLHSRFRLDKQFAEAANVHCECSLLAYIDANELEGLYGYIGLSQPSCIPCADVFAVYNRRGYELETQAYMDRLSPVSWDGLDDDKEATLDDDKEATLDDDEATVDDDKATVDDEDEDGTEDPYDTRACPKAWFPIRARRSDGRVTLPWVAPKLRLDEDGDTSRGLLAALVNDLEKAWSIDHYWSALLGTPDVDMNSFRPNISPEDAARKMFPRASTPPSAFGRI